MQRWKFSVGNGYMSEPHAIITHAMNGAWTFLILTTLAFALDRVRRVRSDFINEIAFRRLGWENFVGLGCCDHF